MTRKEIERELDKIKIGLGWHRSGLILPSGNEFPLLPPVLSVKSLIDNLEHKLYLIMEFLNAEFFYTPEVQSKLIIRKRKKGKK